MVDRRPVEETELRTSHECQSGHPMDLEQLGRVADAVDAQDDMQIVGVTKTGPSFGCGLAAESSHSTAPLMMMLGSLPLLNLATNVMVVLSDLLAIADVVDDCAPGKIEETKILRNAKAAGIKYIFQGGEKLMPLLDNLTPLVLIMQTISVLMISVVSCNTTGLSRTLVLSTSWCGSLKVECPMIQRGLPDPEDSKKGPINAIAPVLRGAKPPWTRCHDCKT